MKVIERVFEKKFSKVFVIDEIKGTVDANFYNKTNVGEV